MATIPSEELAQIVALHRRGELAAAESGYLTLWRRYGDLEALHLLGLVYRQTGDAAAAVELIGTALQQADPPGPAIWWYNLANGLSDLGDRRTARYAFATACELDPAHLEMAVCAAQAHLDADDYEECRKRLASALARHPRQPDLLFIRAKLALAQNDAAACLEDCKTAMEMQPQAAGLPHLAGQALFSLDRPQDAIPYLERALALDSELAEAWNDLGLCRRGLDESIDHFRRALALRPRWALAEFNLAHALLLAGAYREGFCRYEARWRRGVLSPRPFVAPLWQGQRLAAWQTLLLHAEQGIGDTLQMMRFIPAARRKAGCRLAVELPASLLTLARASLPGDIALHARLDEAGSRLPPFDCHLPLMSLPRLLGVDSQQLDGAPYLTAPPRPKLTGRLPKARCFGLIWAGNPDFPLDRSRSIPLADLAPLFQIAGISWVSLQKGKAATELTDRFIQATPCATILDLAADLTDFADTAAVMAKLDGVVAVDTGSAHLAAALGCPAWILLPAHFEWRWGRSGSATPWYRSARLIRRGDSGVAGQIVALCHDLTAWIDGHISAVRRERA